MAQPQRNTAVRYYDTSALERSSRFPKKSKALALVLVILAAVIGIAAFLSYNYTVLQAPARMKAAVDEALAKDVSYNLPLARWYAGWEPEEVLADLTEYGYTHFEVPSSDPAGNTRVVFHAPDTLSAEEAAALYEKGISKLEPAQAAQLLYGSWELSTSSDSGSGIRIRYADFKSQNVDAAIASALSQQQLGETEILESGTDASGNTYQTGKIEIGDEEYTWRISALKLSDVYSVDISDTAIYVGIRINKQ